MAAKIIKDLSNKIDKCKYIEKLAERLEKREKVTTSTETSSGTNPGW